MGAGSGNVLVVVGRDQGELYEYFRWGFTRASGVEVVLDRRLGERRGRATNGQGLTPERRKSARRRSGGTRAELFARRFLIARRDPHAGARDWGSLRG
jgi:hypothetical protein